MILHSEQRIHSTMHRALSALCPVGDDSPYRTLVLALAVLKRFDILPPHNQSLSAIASNLQKAVARLSTVAPQCIVPVVSFTHATNGEAIEPSQLKEAVKQINEVRGGAANADAYARVITQCAEQWFSVATQCGINNFSDVLARLLSPSLGEVIQCSATTSGVLAGACAQSIRAEWMPKAQRPPMQVVYSTEPTTLDALVNMVWNVPTTILPQAQLQGLLQHAPKAVYTVQELLQVYTADTTAELPERAQCVVYCAEQEYKEQYQKLQPFIQQCIERDYIETVVRIAIPAQQGMLIIVLNAHKSQQARGHILFVNDEEKPSVGTARTITQEILEELSVARELFVGESQYTARIKNSKVLAKHCDVHPSNYLRVKTKQANAISMIAGIPSQEYHMLARALNYRGVSIYNYFVQRDTSTVLFSPVIMSRHLLKMALNSQPDIKDQEQALNFSFAKWWYITESEIFTAIKSVEAMRSSFSKAMYAVRLLDDTTLRATYNTWWNNVQQTFINTEEHGAHSVLAMWCDDIIDRADEESSELWSNLSPFEEYMLEKLAPAILRRVKSSLQTIAELHTQQHQIQFNKAEPLIKAMLQKQQQATNILIASHSSSDRARLIEQRIHELQEYITEQKQRMANLHVDAKKRTTMHNSGKELFDSTMSLQDELAQLIAQLVPAQTELRMLQQSLKPFAEVQERLQNEHNYIYRLTGQLSMLLNETLRSLSAQEAQAVFLDIQREHLLQLLESALQHRKEKIVQKLEFWWDEYHSGKILSATA